MAASALLTDYERELFSRWNGPTLDDPHPELPGAGLAPPAGLFLIARVDGEPAGCVGLRSLDDHHGELKRMFVRPAHRGRGLGRQLLEAAEAAARTTLGLRRVRLDTMAELVEARSLYLSAGYVEIGRYNTNPYARHWLEKDLGTGQPGRAISAT